MKNQDATSRSDSAANNSGERWITAVRSASAQSGKARLAWRHGEEFMQVVFWSGQEQEGVPARGRGDAGADGVQGERDARGSIQGFEAVRWVGHLRDETVCQPG